MILNRLTALAAGAALMYFFDPVSGRRRRALLRDQLVHYRHEFGDYADATYKDLRNRAQGVVAETKGAVQRKLGERGGTSPVDVDLSK
jgi:hypothetical protein